MKVAKAAALFLSGFMLCMSTACGQSMAMDTEPNVSQMRSICNLAVMDCYYHNVAKFREEGEGGFFGIGRKEKHFWIEYSGVVRFGINAAYVTVDASGTDLSITLPAAEVQSCKVDSSSLTENSYIVAKDSDDITAEDEVKAFEEAQVILEDQARNDQTLLMQAQQRAQILLENYVDNIGDAVGKEYHITWVYLDTEGNPLEKGGDAANPEAANGSEATAQSAER